MLQLLTHSEYKGPVRLGRNQTFFDNNNMPIMIAAADLHTFNVSVQEVGIND
ncbi:hypothetical protein D3C73_822690 [compost metagenome]